MNEENKWLCEAHIDFMNDDHQDTAKLVVDFLKAIEDRTEEVYTKRSIGQLKTHINYIYGWLAEYEELRERLERIKSSF